jgi:hypothetical protein
VKNEEKKDKPNKQAQAWEAWRGGLSAEARKTVCPEPQTPLPVEPVAPAGDEVDQYAAFRRNLSPEAREAVDGLVHAEPTVEERSDQEAVRYCLLECQDGEWPVLRTFKTAEQLARRMGALEGEDMVLVPLFGVPLKFTMGKQRYLYLPDGETAVTVPLVERGPVKVVDASLVGELEIQTDGFVGPPALAETHLDEDDDAPRERVPSYGQPDDDDDDDDDDDE